MCASSKIIDFTLSKYRKLSSLSWASPRILCGTKEVKIVSYNTSNHNYPIVCDNGECYSLNGKHPSGQNLTIYYNKKCPIEDGRLVSDYTFAVRLSEFLKDIQPTDPCSDEELQYLREVSRELLEYQVNTAKDIDEINYLKRLGLKK